MARSLLAPSFLAVLLLSPACRQAPTAAPATPATSPAAAPARTEPGTSPVLIGGARSKELVAAGALLLDVRTRDEYGAGHLPGAVLIPLQELEERVAELGPKDRPVVVYCHSGRRAAKAARIVQAAGHPTYDLGAMQRWNEP